ncbi:MAG: hypothetical protein HY791_01475 [Deltaproteobacteria bacterium]|nr:hypothetical protein [Deltaproteobacteria bacterium]
MMGRLVSSLLIALVIGQPIVIFVPPSSRTASVAATHLVDEIEGETRVAPAPALDPSVLMVEVERLWPGSIGLVLDPVLNEAWVVRSDDRPRLIRRLPSREVSPYALAVAAAELVRIAVAERAESPRAPPANLELAASLAFGVEVAPGFEPIVGGPVLAVDLRRRSARNLALLGVRARGPSASGVAVEAAQIEYRRFDLSGRVGLGRAFEGWEFLGFLDGGVSFVGVRGLRDKVLLGEVNRAQAFIGFGLEADIELWRALRATVCLEGAEASSPADFVGGQAVLLAESPARARVSLGLSWIFP